MLWSICSVGVVLAITSCWVHLANPELVATSANNHPRLFFDASDIPTLQTQAATTHQEIWIPIRDYVDSQLGTSPPASAPPAGDINTYRSYGNQLIPFAFACIITDDAGYCDLARTYLLTYAAWEQWGEDNHRDLGHAHMLLGNAIAYDWLYNTLTPAERQTVRESLASWAQKMCEASSAGFYLEEWANWWRKSYLQNHFWINHGALGMAGLALLGEDDRAQTWIDQASSKLSRVQYMLNGIKDGSWHESIPYQNYGLTMSLPFMVNLRRIQGTEILPHVYLRNYPYWRLYNHIPNSTQFILAYGNFEWSWGNAYGPQNLLRFVASEYGNGYAEWMAQQLIAADGRYGSIWSAPWYVFEFLYYDPTILPQWPMDLPKARAFPDLEGVIWRTGWGEDDLIFGLKTGAYGGRFAFDTFTQEVHPWEPPCVDTGCALNIDHDHDDSNGFYIHRAGQWLAPENEDYGRSATVLHNTLLIDGQGQYRPPNDHYGKYPEDFIGSDGFLEATATTPGFAYVAADVTRRYKNIAGLEDITRYVVFVRPDYFVMLDNLAADAAHQYDWVCHFGESVSVEGDWVRGNAGDGQILGIGIAAPQPFTATTGNDGYPYVHIRPASPVDDVRLIHILYPTEDASWNTKPTVDILDDTGEAAAVRVEMNDGSGRTDDVLFSYAQPISNTAVALYYYDGQVAVVTRGADDGLEKLFVYGGTFLTDQAMGKVLVTNLDESEPFEATYSGQTVAVHGNILTEVTLYAPQAEHLTLNGTPWSFTRSGEYITFNVELIYLPLILSDSPMALGQATTLTATVAAGSNVAYAWAFGDGATGRGTVVTHTYLAVGIYTVIVTASNSFSVVTATTIVTVEEAVGGLSAVNDSPTVLGQATTLTATVVAGSNVAYTWAFGDGSTGNGAVVTRTYPAIGTYSTAVTTGNSVSVLTMTTTVTVTPTAAPDTELTLYLPLIFRSYHNSDLPGEPLSYTHFLANAGN